MDKKILGISFSTRMLGLAVFNSNLLMDYSLKLHKEKFAPQKKELFLSSLHTCVASYNIQDIALSIPDAYHQTDDFKELLSAIISFAENNGIQVTEYRAKELYLKLGSPVKRTRNALMKRLVMLYPELDMYYNRELNNRNKYYIKLFEAVGVGAYHWLEQNS